MKWQSNIRDISESNIIDNSYKSDSSDIIHRGDSSDRSYTIVDNLYTYIVFKQTISNHKESNSI